MIPPGVDLSAIAPAPPSGRRRPVVVHAPSSRRRKGTDHVLAACAGLDVDLRIIEGLRHDEALEHYRDADIVVDQLNAGWYGLFAIECMALGKPVITFLHDEAVRRTEDAYGVPVPIVNATAGTLQERLEELVALGASGRDEIGQASRAYVEQVHDLELVTDRLVELYESVLEPSPRAGRGAAPRPRRPPRRARRSRSATPTSTRRSPRAPPRPPGRRRCPQASAHSSAGSAGTRRSTASAASSRASSPSSCCRSTRATSARPTTARSRRCSP